MAQVRYTRNLFLRGIIIIYLFAFLSFYVQIPGLYGDNGLLPARAQLDLEVHASLHQKFKQKPTLLWFAPHIGLNVEYMLDVLSLLGIICSFAGFVSQRYCTSLIFATLWLLYYSLYQVGKMFMSYNWDLLLLEVGFLCIFIAPFWYSQRGKTNTPSDAVTFWSVRWLLFRLIFSNGVVKLTSGCPLWWKLDALKAYFQSQPLPTPLAWYAYHLPTWFLRLMTVGTNIIELVIPFLFLLPNRKVKVIAFYIQVFLQIFIITTGNYNFFNFLTICLCISLLDDQFFYKRKVGSNFNNRISTVLCFLVYAGIIYGACIYYNLKILDNWTIQSNIAFTQEQVYYILSRAVPISIYIGMASLGIIVVDAIVDYVLSTDKGIKHKIVTIFTTIFYTAFVCSIFAISIVPYATLHQSHNSTIPSQLKEIYKKIEHFRLVNNYGLLKHIPDGRSEIIIEGSNSIEGPWKEYEFLYKPGNVNNSLSFVAPHQPRLDWNMWSPAFGVYSQHPWIVSLVYRLLNGQREVLALMNTVESPFQGSPPKYIKANVYHYYYTSWNQTSNRHAWWRREKDKEYIPILSRDQQSLIEYLSKLKIIQDTPIIKIRNEPLKLFLDSLRSLTSHVEASLLIWGVFTAGCAIIMTGYNTVTKKK